MGGGGGGRQGCGVYSRVGNLIDMLYSLRVKVLPLYHPRVGVDGPG